ncbi:MAG: hypothetical protein COB63_05305 [Candidatus Pelagibacter sp.]|nr:MAG: hypothetical protein COB63_05305 [Candidatus Pelagibacter sp.]
MGWQTDIIKYGMIVGGAGVGVYLLSRKISGALEAPAKAAGEAWSATGEALGTAASTVGEALGGAGEAAGNYVQTISNCPTCNGWPNLFGTPCEECAEHGQKDLPGAVPPGGEAGDVYYDSCVGEMCEHRDAADANQGGDIKADKPIDIWGWLGLGEPKGQVTKVQDDPSQENWFKDPVPGLLEAGADIQRFFFGGETIAEVLKVDNVVEQAVPQGYDFTVPTGYRTAATGFKNTTESSTLNIGNNVLDGTAATIEPTQVNATGGFDPFGGLLSGLFGSPTVKQQPTYNNTVHANTDSNGLSSSTVVNTSAPSVNVNTAAEANFNASSTQVNTTTNPAGNTGRRGSGSAGAGGSTSSSGSSSSSSAGGSSSSSSGSSSSGGSGSSGGSSSSGGGSSTSGNSGGGSTTSTGGGSTGRRGTGSAGAGGSS